ncbi:hypothetical protein PAAG_07681 [Paracoccidioides lutzii Pb01]|uniref:GPI anchored cell wall protein n=2 Tax=Paracoccidioides TaxID=38946 RepID=C1HAM7_PARBA|nr:hypothetical protein PAAG_07681 [Paracoccidioides lutzii Pb01]AAR87496.1 GPI-anchored cell wall protein [Paracoccidioides brasiliensis]EEH37400.1 hypothetical protein PAAG_07681 [Paracoccidioides lutzii Pb01]
MLAAKSIFVVALLALFNIVFAIPPGCLISAVNTQKDPADLKSVCANKNVQKEILRLCPDNKVKEALNSFSTSCAEAGHKVSLIDTSSKPTGSQSTSAPTGATGSGSGSGGPDGKGSSTTSGGSGASPTGSGAGYVHKVDSMAVTAIVAFVGFVSAL